MKDKFAEVSSSRSLYDFILLYSTSLICTSSEFQDPAIQNPLSIILLH